MERFLRRENIKRYRRLLREAKDEAGRRLIQKLLSEEEQKEVTSLSRCAQLRRRAGEARFCDNHHSGRATAALDLGRHSKGRNAMAPELVLLAAGLILFTAGVLAAAPDEAF